MSLPTFTMPANMMREAARATPETTIDIQLVDASAGRRFRLAWQKLAAETLEPNVFYEPDFLLPAIDALAEPGTIKLLTMWSGERLIFLLPYHLRSLRPFRLAEAFTHPYATTTVPLVEPNMASQAIRHWLEIGCRSLGATAWRLQSMPDQGPFQDLMCAAMGDLGIGHRILSRHCRAMLAPAKPEKNYLDDVLSTKAAKEIRRLERRLRDQGRLEHRLLAGTDAKEGFEEFLQLEAAGWKGRARTAMLSHKSTADFGHQAIGALGQRDHVRIDQLALNDRIIAATVTLISAGCAWLWKVAYDEAFAKYSPAVQLIVAMTQDIAANRPGIRLDSCAIPDHPMIDRLWAERLPIADIMIGDTSYTRFLGAVWATKAFLATKQLIRRARRA